MKLLEEDGQTLVVLTKEEFKRLAVPYAALYDQAKEKYESELEQKRYAMEHAKLLYEQAKEEKTFAATLKGLFSYGKE